MKRLGANQFKFSLSYPEGGCRADQTAALKVALQRQTDSRQTSLFLPILRRARIRGVFGIQAIGIFVICKALGLTTSISCSNSFGIAFVRIFQTIERSNAFEGFLRIKLCNRQFVNFSRLALCSVCCFRDRRNVTLHGLAHYCLSNSNRD